MREDHKARILEAREVTDMWKQAYSTSEKARMEDHPMIRESVENGRAILKLIESIREAGEEDHVAS